MQIERLGDVWVISDTHFGHANINQYCFRPPGCDQLLLRSWEETVPKDATVLHLGDLLYQQGLGQDPSQGIAYPAGRAASKRAIRKLPGRKLLIRGNHDKLHDDAYRDFGFEIVNPFTITVGVDTAGVLQVDRGEEELTDRWDVSFSHYPLNPGEPTHDRHLRVHGHIHNNGYNMERFIPFKRNHVNVSVEMLQFQPVNLRMLLEGALLGRG